MVSLFRSSTHDAEALRSTVRSLRETSVPGLAAALSWRPRKVEKLLVEELTRPGTAMAYDPARRVVRWVPVTATVWKLPPPPVDPRAAAPGPVARPQVDLGPPLHAPPPVVQGGGLKSLCPSCHVALAASASPSLSVCPHCGRLFTPRNLAERPQASHAAPPPAPPPTPSPPAPTVRRNAAPSSDRRSQELLAAYMTAQPIPCPRCRTTLRHRGLSEYGCPSCGEVVRFTSHKVVISDKPEAKSPAAL